MLGRPDTQSIQSPRSAEQPDVRHHITVQANVDDRVLTFCSQQPTLFASDNKLFVSPVDLPVVKVELGFAGGAQDFATAVEYDDVTAQELTQRGSDT
ncbi:hypothetical protein [Rhodococcus erythropolis]